MIINFLRRSWFFLVFLAIIIAKILARNLSNPKSWQEIEDYPRLSKILARKQRRQALGKSSNFMRNLKYFWKLSILMVSRYLREPLRRNCVQKTIIFRQCSMLSVVYLMVLRIWSHWTFCFVSGLHKNLRLKCKVWNVVKFFMLTLGEQVYQCQKNSPSFKNQ